jgi:antitoxin component YwqK of YwqJK toxin-antitoxin module
MTGSSITYFGGCSVKKIFMIIAALFLAFALNSQDKWINKIKGEGEYREFYKSGKIKEISNRIYYPEKLSKDLMMKAIDKEIPQRIVYFNYYSTFYKINSDEDKAAFRDFYVYELLSTSGFIEINIRGGDLQYFENNVLKKLSEYDKDIFYTSCSKQNDRYALNLTNIPKINEKYIPKTIHFNRMEFLVPVILDRTGKYLRGLFYKCYTYNKRSMMYDYNGDATLKNLSNDERNDFLQAIMVYNVIDLFFKYQYKNEYIRRSRANTADDLLKILKILNNVSYYSKPNEALLYLTKYYKPDAQAGYFMINKKEVRAFEVQKILDIISTTDIVQVSQEDINYFLDNEQKIWHENGKMKLDANWKFGQKDGEFKEWDANGEIITHKVYKNDELIQEE